MAAKKSVSNKVVATEPTAKSIGGSPTATKGGTPTTTSGSKNRVLLLDVAPETKSTGGAPTIEKSATPATAGGLKQQVSLLDVGSETKSLTKAVTALDTEPGTESATGSATPQIGPVSTSKSLDANSFLPKAEKPARALDGTTFTRSTPPVAHSSHPPRQVGAGGAKALGGIAYPRKRDFGGGSPSNSGTSAGPGVAQESTSHPNVKPTGANFFEPKIAGGSWNGSVALEPFGPPTDSSLDDAVFDVGDHASVRSPTNVRGGLWTEVEVPVGQRLVDVGANGWGVWATTETGEVYKFDRRSRHWALAPRPNSSGATRVSVTFDEVPWVVCKDGEVLSLVGFPAEAAWHSYGRSTAVDIGAGIGLRADPQFRLQTPVPDSPLPSGPLGLPFPVDLPPHHRSSPELGGPVVDLLVYRANDDGRIDRLVRTLDSVEWQPTSYAGTRVAVRDYPGGRPLWFVANSGVFRGSKGPPLQSTTAPDNAIDIGVGRSIAAVIAGNGDEVSGGSPIYVWSRSGLSWTKIPMGGGVNLDVAADGTIWVVDRSGKLFVFDDRKLGVWPSAREGSEDSGGRIPCALAGPSLIGTVLPNPVELGKRIYESLEETRVQKLTIVPALVSWDNFAASRGLYVELMSRLHELGLRVILNLMPIFTVAPVYPAGVASSAAPEDLISRFGFREFIDSALDLPFIDEVVSYVSFGNEIDVYLSVLANGLDGADFDAYVDSYARFVADARQAVRQRLPYTPVGVTTRLVASLRGTSLAADIVDKVAQINDETDVLIYTHYPEYSATVNHAEIDPDLFAARTLWNIAKKPVVFQELGYPSGFPQSGNGEQNQRSFLESFLQVWNEEGSRIAATCVFNLYDQLVVGGLQEELWALVQSSKPDGKAIPKTKAYCTLQKCPGTGNFIPINFDARLRPTLGGGGTIDEQQEAIFWARDAGVLDSEKNLFARFFATAGLLTSTGTEKAAWSALQEWAALNRIQQ